MTAPAFAVTETLTIVRAGSGDKYGDRTGSTDTPVPGCVVWPTGSTEQTFQEDVVADSLTALMPPGTDVRATDQVLRGGDLFEVAGRPETFRNPFDGTDPGVQVLLRRSS